MSTDRPHDDPLPPMLGAWDEASASTEFDIELIAAYADGDLTEAERDKAEAILAQSAEARALLGALLDSDTEQIVRDEPTTEAKAQPQATGDERPAPARPTSPWRPVAWIAAAAIVLVAIGLAWQARSGSEPGSPTTLADTFEALRATAPTALGDVKVLDKADLDARPVAAMRGGLRIHAPRGRILTDRVRFECDPPAGRGAYILNLISADGESFAVWRSREARSDQPADSPALSPGAYALRVTHRGVVETTQSDVRFVVAGPDERAAWKALVVQAETLVSDEAQRALVLAQIALQKDYIAEAARWGKTAGNDDLARATRRAVAAARGITEDD